MAALSACGDSGSETTSTPTTSGNGDSSVQKEAKSGDPQPREKGGSDDSSQDPEQVATPLKVSGGGSSQFQVKGGDNSIQEWGEESEESELQAAAEAVHGFYVARAEEDWARACTYLAKSMAQQLEQLAAQAPKLRDRGCGPILKVFTRPLPASVRRQTTIVDAGSLRIGDKHSFLIYYDGDETPNAMPLENEDGEWKLTLLSATPLG